MSFRRDITSQCRDTSYYAWSYWHGVQLSGRKSSRVNSRSILILIHTYHKGLHIANWARQACLWVCTWFCFIAQKYPWAGERACAEFLHLFPQAVGHLRLERGINLRFSVSIICVHVPSGTRIMMTTASITRSQYMLVNVVT